MDAVDKDVIRNGLRARPPGEFHLADVVAGWDDKPIGDKVATGNAFLRAVRDGEFEGIRDTGRKADGGHIYVKES